MFPVAYNGDGRQRARIVSEAVAERIAATLDDQRSPDHVRFGRAGPDVVAVEAPPHRDVERPDAAVEEELVVLRPIGAPESARSPRRSRVRDRSGWERPRAATAS
jgi:hypothetical protein